MTSSDHTTYYFNFYTKRNRVIKYARFTSLLSTLLCNAFLEEFLDRRRNTDDGFNVKLRIITYDTIWFQYFERATVKRSHPYSKYGLCRKKILTEMSIQRQFVKIYETLLCQYHNTMHC